MEATQADWSADHEAREHYYLKRFQPMQKYKVLNNITCAVLLGDCNV